MFIISKSSVSIKFPGSIIKNSVKAAPAQRKFVYKHQIVEHKQLIVESTQQIIESTQNKLEDKQQNVVCKHQIVEHKQ